VTDVLPSAGFTENTKGIASIKRVLFFEVAAVNLLLFSKQGSLDLMLLDNHGDFDVFSYTMRTRPQTIAPLPWK
jgi:hypothetical protein